MKYVIRALKYLLYFLVIFFIIVAIVWLLNRTKMPDASFTELFKEGSLPQMAIFFVVIAAIYPALGFVKRKIYTNGDFAKYENLIGGVMEQMGFEFEKEDEETKCYRIKSRYMRGTRMGEDRVTFFRNEDPIICEGLRKDVDRIARNIDFQIRDMERERNGETEEQ